MNRIPIKHIFFLLLISTLIGCQSDLEMESLIDVNKPFHLTLMKESESNGVSSFQNYEILVDSGKWKKLVAFLNKNMDNWESAPASYAGEVYVRQEEFKLTYTKDSDVVVINFLDQGGQARQYRKKIEAGGLNFLLE